MLDQQLIIKRNNIKVVLLTNGDSLKSILLLLSFNLGVTNEDEMKKISNKLICKKKFTALVASVLKRLDELLNQISFLRAGIGKATTLSKEMRESYMNKIKFAECIHFIVCSIDNIVHFEKEVNEGFYSKVIGNRGEDVLKKTLIHFLKILKQQKNLKKISKKKN